MEVILLETIRNLGSLGDQVKVAPGYARNFLIPKEKAVQANEENRAVFEARRAELELKAKNSLDQAAGRAKQLEGLSLTIVANASEEGKLFGSVGPNEIHHALTEKGIDVATREISMPEGVFRSTGEYEVEIHLHPEVKASIQLIVEAASTTTA